MGAQKKLKIVEEPVAEETQLTLSEKDFNSLEMQVAFKNKTSMYTLTPEAGAQCVVREFHESGLVLEVPRDSCAKNHVLAVDVQIKNAKKPMKLSALVRVKKIETEEKDGPLVVYLEFIKVATKSWTDFTKEYSETQTEVLDLLEKIRGY